MFHVLAVNYSPLRAATVSLLINYTVYSALGIILEPFLLCFEGLEPTETCVAKKGGVAAHVSGIGALGRGRQCFKGRVM